MKKIEAALHRGHDHSAKYKPGTTNPRPVHIIPHADFIAGSYGAAALLCAMFVVLSIGCVMFGW